LRAVTQSRAADPDEFRRWMAPTIDALNALARAIEDIGPRHHDVPGMDSQAMRELASESEYSARSGGWEHPISDAHNFGAMALWAAADSVRTFAAAFAGAQRPPLYGHLVLADLPSSRAS
jgi:hypothetical protein